MHTEDPGHSAALQEAWEDPVRERPLMATRVETSQGHFHPIVDGPGGSERLAWVPPRRSPGENRSSNSEPGAEEQRGSGAGTCPESNGDLGGAIQAIQVGGWATCRCAGGLQTIFTYKDLRPRDFLPFILIRTVLCQGPQTSWKFGEEIATVNHVAVLGALRGSAPDGVRASGAVGVS